MADKLEFRVNLDWWTKGVALRKGLAYDISANDIWEVVEKVRERHDRPDEHTHYISIRQVFSYEKEEQDGS